MDVSEYLERFTDQIVQHTHNALNHFLISNEAQIHSRKDEQLCLLATIGVMIGALSTIRKDIEDEIHGRKPQEEQLGT